MMISTSVGKKILHWCGASLLIMSFVVLAYSPAIMSNRIETAEAATDGAALVQRAALWIQRTAVAAKDWVIAKAQQIDQWVATNKEMVLDGLAWTVVNVILEKMSQDIIKWINSGFKGRPAFVQNPEAYFIDIADRVVGDSIWKSGDFKFLCSPFALNVKLALELQYIGGRGPDFQYTSQCTLSSVVNNVEGFFDGDFLSSGWKGWMEMTTKPQNNVFGAMALGSMHLNAQINSRVQAKSDALAWGRGLLSTEVCTEVQDESGGHTECNTVTPGAAIQDQLSRTLSIPVERLTVADEFNEIINALFNQLVMKAFSEVGGLLGSTESNIRGAPGTGSYFTDLGNATRPISGVELDSMTRAIALENRYLSAHINLLNQILAVEGYKDAVYGVANACHSGNLSPTLIAMKAELRTDIAKIRITIARLEAMVIEYTNIQNDPTLTQQQRLDRQIALTMEFSTMRGNNELHDETDLAILEMIKIRDVEEAITAYKQEVDTACVYYGDWGGGD